MSERYASLWAVVPVKEIGRSKQRLSAALFSDERERLVRAMLRDVLVALRAASGLADVLVITRDGEVGALAKECGAQVLAERGAGDLNAALRQAAAHLVAAGAPGLLVVPADVPAVRPDDISTLAREHGPSPAVTLVSDRRGVGTNALAASPPDLCPFLFGEDSFERHLAAAREAGVEPRVFDARGLRYDVDVEHDLDEIALQSPGPETSDLLRRFGRVVAPARRNELATSSEERL
ncbi:MAG TPA: 2-phospho-L-lactate guanylyltransferase [Thermoanaerobaculia bacterium]|nr:2-phospho-L-lactate guanylyltransferase [Thermoanaerobaculia bacterium]